MTGAPRQRGQGVTRRRIPGRHDDALVIILGDFIEKCVSRENIDE